ncbi:ABC transporter ATP-binding protein [bacterium]|nr:ABC transporter ATP-binding protein [bacterium]
MPLLAIRDLKKCFGDLVVVDGISFSLSRGEILGLLGPNGAGKTTTIQMLLGLITPTSGEIQVFGLDLAHHRQAILQRVNFSSTYVSLPYSLSVRENLLVFGRLYGVPNLRRKVDETIELLDLKGKAERPAKELSSGQLTRLHLAKALLNDPELLFLDEPTASLDPDVADRIRHLLLRIRDERKLSILFTTHNLREMEMMADRVVFLNQGKILASGTPAEIVAQFSAEDLEAVFLKVARGEVEDQA